MSDDLARLENMFSPLMRNLSAPRQSRAMAEVATYLRRSQAKRIASQKNPDGSKFAPRKKAKKAAKPMRFIYKNAQGRVREAEIKSYHKDGDSYTGYDIEAGGIRTFRKSRIQMPLVAKSGSVRSQKERTSRRMFERLRTAEYLKKSSTAGTATISVDGSAARIARVHQYGLRDKVDSKKANSPVVKYAQRELLGFTPADIDAITDILLKHITNGT